MLGLLIASASPIFPAARYAPAITAERARICFMSALARQDPGIVVSSAIRPSIENTIAQALAGGSPNVRSELRFRSLAVKSESRYSRWNYATPGRFLDER